MNTPTVYIFGAFPIGHHLYYAQRPLRSVPLRAVPLGVRAACDPATGVAPEAQHEGLLTGVKVPEGWSFVSWWDRQGDQRYGSHTGILAPGAWTTEQLLAAGREAAPWAFRVTVRGGA